MLYVIGIKESPRKAKNSATMLDHTLKGAETELVNLTDLHFSGCKSCFACKLLNGKRFGRCTLQYDNYDLYVGDYKLDIKRKIQGEMGSFGLSKCI